LQHAMEAVEMGLGAFSLSIWRVDIGHGRRVNPSPWAIIPRMSLSRPRTCRSVASVVAGEYDRSFLSWLPLPG
jgi:hypothetical protein